MTSLKEELKGKLTKKELEILKTAFDMVGDIAILEIDDELKTKEKVIAETLLKIQKNIKVVCKKTSIHSGTYRTQKLKILAGERRKETVYKENGVSLLLNVEKVYFSPRLSTERKRIAKQLKRGEEVLCMFSGCGPYPLVLMKEEPTINIDSIEINPVAFDYQKKNIILNKSIVRPVIADEFKKDKDHLEHAIKSKIRAFRGDVKNIVSDLEDGEIGASINYGERLHKGLNEIVIGECEEDIEYIVKDLSGKNSDMVIKVPNNYYGKLGMGKDSLARLMLFFSKIKNLIIKPNVRGFVVDPGDVNLMRMLVSLDYIRENYKHLHEKLYIENQVIGFYKESDMKAILKKGYKICFNISNYFSVYKSNIKLIDFLDDVKENDIYFRISDSSGEVYPRSNIAVGKGKVLFDRISGYLKFGCVISEDDKMYSIQKINQFKGQKKYDRILMPLPKSAEDFLGTALKASKKGTVVHFYDFLNVDEFYLAEEKIEKACKRHKLGHKIKNIVKCGQHAPRTFRICVDFVVE